MYKSLVLASLSLLWVGKAVAEDGSAREQFVQGMERVSQGNRYHDRARLMEGRGILERAQLSNPEDALATYYLAYAEYELIRHGMITKDSGLYDRYVDIAVAHAQRVLRLRPEWSEGFALLANIYGIQISHSWVKSATLGPEANALMQRAIESDSTNPRAWLVNGIMKFNTPAFFGGSVEVALANFTRALELFEKPSQSEPLSPGWGHLETYAWLGRALEKNERPDEALAAFRKALEIDPEFVWVKRVLLPALTKKLTQPSAQ
ncbi:MAG: tetratricopeptide repeat protein [Ignavibacteria bacterium]|nr:tetratricopeptide repeat protein [Ignavibacteria bacterium]